jgi:hypothetical protein
VLQSEVSTPLSETWSAGKKLTANLSRLTWLLIGAALALRRSQLLQHI